MTDLEIAQSNKTQKIEDIAKKLNIQDKIEKYGNYKAKVDYSQISSSSKGQLILITATSPTPYGEGKTTISIGLLDALVKSGYKATASLREPSLGPVFGLKGGATGGGYAQIVPMEDINLNFTGDLHAITAANNLLCAAIDNHIHQGNELDINSQNILFNRCLDVNDRALKDITINSKTYTRQEKFSITAASEIMAILCLSKDLNNLRFRLDNILIAYSNSNKPIFAKDLNITGSLLVILKDALKPNLVQTLEHNPVFVHGGPFANIAHGCSSLIATNTALSLSDYCVTEAGFGSDLGALKFYDIKCRNNNLNPAAIVIVTTIRALKYNGHNKLEEGISNLQAHLDICHYLSPNIIVCLNKFPEDTKEEIAFVSNYCYNLNIPFSISTSYSDGSKGSMDLAQKVIAISQHNTVYKPLYNLEDSLESKITKIVQKIYHAGSITYTPKALSEIAKIKENNLANLPICIAKTQYSLTDNKNILGNPTNFPITIQDVKIYNGAGFITIYLGNIITMPGLPLHPNYEKIDLIDDKIIGLF